MSEITSKPGIYLLTNKINGKVYVGKSVRIRERMRCYRHYEKTPTKNHPVSYAIYKYGWENFEVSILESFDQIENEKLLKIETEWIKKLNSTNQKIGYNICTFSNDTTGRKASKKERQRMSESMKGIKNPFYGKAHTEETKILIGNLNRQRFSGKNNPMFGRHHTKATRKKLSELHKGIGAKAVQQIDKKTGKIIKIWPSAKEAAYSFGKFNQCSAITKVCKGYICKNAQGAYILRSAMGFKWQYN